MCICGNDKTYSECCEKIILEIREPKTPLELMRSRYSAYVRGNGSYLVKSAVQENQYEEDIELIEDFSAQLEWLKLNILNVQNETVEFKAYYRDSDKIQVLHEKSNFVQIDGVWKYKDGELYNSKVERNEPCPCGSGKKFKKCCA